MFESAEIGHKLDKATFKAEVPKLRERLLEAQYELFESKNFPLIILIGGVEGAGKGETVNTLNAWMDPRHIETHAMDLPSDEELGHPPMWRFWRRLPPKGKSAIFFGSWYTAPIIDRVINKTDTADLDQSIDQIKRFERMLADEGALLIKFWFHLSKKAQKKRLKKLEKDDQNSWRVSKRDWEFFEAYDKFCKVSEHALRLTHAAHAPWIVVEGQDERYRHLTVAKTLYEAMRARLKQPPPPPASTVAPPLPPVDQRSLLRNLNLGTKLDKDKYEKQLEKLQARLGKLTREERFKDMGGVAVFEGPDAAGKGGAIRRVTGAIDARYYRVIRSAAPSEDELARPYLWRFWRHVPRLGGVALFDRSWYGRVLVERIEGFAAEADWLRAYSEINDFEGDMIAHGLQVVKFWLWISKEEQLRRFQEREQTGFKRFKITQEDWRNRDKWDAYELAVNDMIDRTSTEIAPWTLVEAEDKYYARIKVLRTLCDRIEAAL